MFIRPRLLSLFLLYFFVSNLVLATDLRESKLCGEPSKQEIDLLTLRANADRIYANSIHSILDEKKWNVGEIWVLKELMKFDQDIRLPQLLNSQIDKLSGDPFLRLVDPKAPLVTLSEHPGTGRDRFYTYMLAVVGTPADQALSYVREFILSDAKGYVQTHQFLAMVWFEQTNIGLSAEFMAKKKLILSRIAAEQERAEVFSDLYAERMAILLHYGNPKTPDVHRWIQTMVSAYLQNGRWVLYTENIAYDGERDTNAPGVNHTRILSLLSLRLYLDYYCRYPGHIEERYSLSK